MLDTRRSWRVLLHQRDLHTVLAVVTVDLALTVHGITLNVGEEANPFFAPLTSTPLHMAAGIVFYYAVLLVASRVLQGALRKVLASVVFGMHVSGTYTWLRLFTGTGFNVFWFALLVSGATALFYAGYARGVWTAGGTD